METHAVAFTELNLRRQLRGHVQFPSTFVILRIGASRRLSHLNEAADDLGAGA
jgi:hypothetical protein